MRKINRIVIHCSAGSSTQRASAIIAWHTLPVARGGRGWHAPGYHYIIEADGNIVASWPLDRVANGVRGFNADSIHICYTSGLDACGHPADTRTPAHDEEVFPLRSNSAISSDVKALRCVISVMFIERRKYNKNF